MELLTVLYVLVGLLAYTFVALHMLEKHWKFVSKSASNVSATTDRETFYLCLIWPLSLIATAVFFFVIFLIDWGWNIRLWCRARI